VEETSVKRVFAILLVGLSLGGCEHGREPEALAGAEATAPVFVGRPAGAKPFPGEAFAHPGLAEPGRSTMHADGYNSDVHPARGMLGRAVEIATRDGSPLPGGQCATVTFDREGRLVALCASIAGFELQLLAPRTLEMLARFALPMRPSTFESLVKRDPSIVMTDSSGGAYLYLDDQDRAVLADSKHRIRRIAHRERAPGQWEFVVTDSWDIAPYLPTDCMNWNNWFPEGECDPMTAVMPGSGNLIWWVTRRGRVGTLHTVTGAVRLLHLEGEEIQNGFAVASDGVYVVSDHAMYAFDAADDGTPIVRWRESYDRGSARKVGSINQGSGTTPTLIGEHYLTVTDNADERINLLVYRRDHDYAGERLICKVPLFEAGKSATDNSMIGWGRTIIIENNFGYSSAREQSDWSTVAGGIQRIDIRPDDSGCDVVWTSKERVPSVVPKLSAANGLAYFYTFEPQPGGENAWYVIALDARSGETVYRVRTGAGRAFDNNWAPLTIGPDGTVYVGTAEGLVALWDTN